jgi:hydrogenase-4 component B
VSVVTWLSVAVSALLLGALASLVLGRLRAASSWVALGAVTVASVAMWGAVVRCVAHGPDPEVVLLTLPGLGARLAIRCDDLSALFLALTATIAFLATMYSVRYMDRYQELSPARYYPLLLVLFAAIAGAVVTVDFFFFLVFWELLTLSSFFLVAFETENRVGQRAAWKYFFVSHAATFGMVIGALLLWNQGHSFHFADLRGALDGMLVTRPVVAHLVLLLFFLGFATKAGVLPMGSWLPDAYASAPSGATAAFAGTLSKLGIYGVLRVFADFLPLSGATRAWGYLIALAGLGTLFVATLTALRQDQVKRLMSFHLMGQVGYMLLGIGVGLALLRSQPVLGAIALLGGLFHLVNNALYKPALYMAAGAAEYRGAGSSLSAGGGLGRMMPVTALCAGAASLAIAGVPPLNGFASKWLLYASGILGGKEFAGFALAAVVAMFISLVTLASFLKYLGGTFFGPPAPALTDTRDVPVTMLLPQVVLVLLCLALGLGPRFPLVYVHRAIVHLPSASGLPDLAALLGPGAAMGGVGAGVAAVWSPLPMALALVVLGAVCWAGLQRMGGAAHRDVPVWTCGEEVEVSVTRYPASSFYLPFKQAFHGIYPQPHLRAPRFPASARRLFDVDRWLYQPVARAVQRSAYAAGRTHSGIPQVYLLWIVVGAVAVVAIILLTVR